MKKGNHSPNIINALKTRAQFYLLHEGLTQAETAGLLGVTRATINAWSKKHKWSKKQKEKSDKVKFDDSLNSFIAWGVRKHPHQAENLNSLYKGFKSSI